MHDAVIIGGGPAGLHAARRLAGQGHDVVLFEEHDRVGEPVHCAGVLATEAFEEFDLRPDAVLNRLRTVRFFSPAGDTIAYSSDEAEAVVIDRRRFDESLAAQACAAGASLVPAARVHGIEPGSSGVDVYRAGAGPVRARAVVLACGARYTLQRRLGFGVPPRFIHSAQADVPAGSREQVEIHFGEGVAPRGFGWVIPLEQDGRPFARVGVMSQQGATACFQELLARVSDRWGIDAAGAAAAAPRRRMLPLAPLARTYGRRIVLAGDAAGLVKATTGGGIYYSLVSAEIAARVVGDGLRRDNLGEEALGAYEHLWRRRLGAELEAQRALRRVADRLTDGQIDSLFELARTDGIMPLLRRTARFNEHRHFILALLKHPPARRVLLGTLIGRA
jgi:digeranylgeranylglycerophospholipid reductase